MKAATRKIVITKKNEINNTIGNMLDNCRFDSKSRKIYYGYYLGRGKRTQAHSAESTVIPILEAQGYKYKTGNDAPRGGVLGNYVKVSKVAFDFMLALQHRDIEKVALSYLRRIKLKELLK
jgi:hypothetical protein